MKACLLKAPAPVSSAPLDYLEIPSPEPQGDQVLVHVRVCGICRTDLHVVEGELEPGKLPVIPGHQAVGIIEAAGNKATQLAVRTRVGIPWLHRTCGLCRYCRTG